MRTADLAIIGAGPGGYTAAILAAKKGMEVVLVEKHKVGGTCLQVGCIPSKTLLDATKRYEHFMTLETALGEGVPNPFFTQGKYAQLITLTKKRVEKITAGLGGLIKSTGVMLLKGAAEFRGPKQLAVRTDTGDEYITAERILVACGARAKILPGIPYPHERVWTNVETLTSTTRPERVIILGGGAVGCEFASFYAGLSIPVTIIEMMPELLPLEDFEVRREIQNILFSRPGVKIFAQTRIRTVAADTTRVTVTFLDDPTTVTGSHLLIATGIMPATELLGLQAAGVATDERGFIPVSLPSYETRTPGIYAIGDVIAIPDRSHPGLAHVAIAEAERAVDAMCGATPKLLDYDNTPVVTFTHPPVAHVGLTEHATHDQCTPSGETRSFRINYTSLGLAHALGHTRGFLKVIVHQDPRRPWLRTLCGAHIIGEGAPELIHLFSAARALNGMVPDTIDFLKRIIFQHPTWGELIGELVRAIDNEAVHVPARKKI